MWIQPTNSYVDSTDRFKRISKDFYKVYIGMDSSRFPQCFSIDFYENSILIFTRSTNWFFGFTDVDSFSMVLMFVGFEMTSIDAHWCYIGLTYLCPLDWSLYEDSILICIRSLKEFDRKLVGALKEINWSHKVFVSFLQLFSRIPFI